MNRNPIARRAGCERCATAMRIGQRHAQRAGLRGGLHHASISISVFQMLTKGAVSIYGVLQGLSTLALADGFGAAMRAKS